MKQTLVNFGFNKFQERLIFPERPRQPSLDIKSLLPVGSIPFEKTSFDFVSDTVVGGITTQVTSSATYVDVTGLSLEFTLPMKIKALFFWQAVAYIQGQWDDATLRTANVRLVIDGVQMGEAAELPGSRFGDPSSVVIGDPVMFHHSVDLDPGDHIAKLQFGTSNALYEAGIFNEDCRITFIKLG